jgi:hypothetical protein
MFLQVYNLEPWATPLDDKDIVIKSLYFRVFKTDFVNEIHLQCISPLASGITKNTESVWLKYGPDITNNVPPSMEASFGVIVIEQEEKWWNSV